MVQAGRVFCITTPFVLTVGALVCLILSLLAGNKPKNSLDDLYFLKLDLTNITLNGPVNLPASVSSNITLINGALQYAKQNLGLKDYYTIYLRNYCAWNGNDAYAFCSKPQSPFFFDFVNIFGFNETGFNVTQTLPKDLNDGLEVYKILAQSGYWLYVVGIATTCLTLLVGISAIFSRWGSFCTSFIAVLSAAVVLGGTIVISITYATLNGLLRVTLQNQVGIQSALGTRGWILKAFLWSFSVGAALFWLFSICCCSGRSSYNPASEAARRTRAEQTPFTYGRVGSPVRQPPVVNNRVSQMPYMGPRADQSAPLGNLNNQTHGGYSNRPQGQRTPQMAYEQYRHA